ncbi:MAG: arginine N-succinyltransferase [Oleiphilaceae bacterium]|nr:arginine N-succinyltransferase [Oleiphilaceae bacterium]
MWILRPAKPLDLADIESLASRLNVQAPRLPETTDRFLFVLEDTGHGRIRGLAGIDASAGHGQPFYNYRRDALIHACHDLGVSRRIDVLYPSHALTGQSLLCSLLIEPELRQSHALALLSRARLLFIAQHREQFADEVVVELKGLQTETGEVPFWDSLGRHFFHMDFEAADRYSSELSKTFIAELMPPNPIYVTLLTDSAQAAIGVSHPLAVKSRDLLHREGFRESRYIDIFDGGPVLRAQIDRLETVVSGLTLVFRPGESAHGLLYLVASARDDDFRCVLSPLIEGLDGAAVIPAEMASALGICAGDRVQVAAL